MEIVLLPILGPFPLNGELPFSGPPGGLQPTSSLVECLEYQYIYILRVLEESEAS